jgi:pyruvate dehydrogenase E1 component alpha subunit
MLLSRAFDRKAIARQRQGRFGVHAPLLGQEACVVGSVLALDPTRDWVVPTYREVLALAMHGCTLPRIAAMYLGRAQAARIPEGVLVLPIQAALATQLQHATGLAWGLRLQKREGVVLAYFGEGASSEGDAHEAMNLAGVTRAPVVFFMQNNSWAISTPRALQSAAPSLSVRAAGYGFPGEQVDGNDLQAVYAATRSAVERARQGEGPTLIEGLTYRMSFHNTTDDPRLYTDPGELAEAGRRDPVERVKAQLARYDLAGLEAEVAAEVEEAISWAESQEPSRPESIFDHAYERPPDRVRRQREAFGDSSPPSGEGRVGTK